MRRREPSLGVFLVVATCAGLPNAGCASDDKRALSQAGDSAKDDDAESDDAAAQVERTKDAGARGARLDGGAETVARPDAARSLDASRVAADAGPTRDAQSSSEDATTSGEDASTQGGGCMRGQLKGADICTIGDSWIQIPGNQVTTLENHMKKAGWIPEGDHFDRREVSGSTLPSIIATYDRKPTNCKVLIMDGGGIDLFTTRAGDQAAIGPVVQRFEAFLQRVAADGHVKQILYSLYPVIPSTPNLNVNMKPGFMAACAESEVNCQFVDLEPLFMGQHFASDRTHADNQGGVIIGDAWWKALQGRCIAP